MHLIPKAASSVVIIMLAMLVCVSLISACLMVATAQKHHANVINEIEASNFDDTVIANCINNLEGKGFTLEVNEQINISSIKYCEVVLSYNLNLPVFGKVYTGRLVGYAYPGAYLGAA